MRSTTLTIARRSLTATLVAGAISCGGADSPAPPLPSAPVVNPTATIRIRAIPLDGWTLGEAFVLSRHPGGASDSVPIDVNGLAVLRAERGSVLDLKLDVPAPRLYHASAATYTVAGDTTLEVVMIPTAWVIQRGRFRATRRSIDVVKAFGSDNDDTHFLNQFTPERRILTAWPEEALPILVGVDTTGNARRWSAPADSAYFWSAMNDFNEAMGRIVFQPTTSVALTTRNVIGVRIDYENGGYFGALGANWDVCHLPARACNDLHGSVIFARGIFYHSIFDEENFRSMQHEMMHALGFGHGCYWSSVMMHTGPACSSNVPLDVTVDDVAYMELVFRLASVLAMHPQAWNLDEALAGAR